MANLEVGGQWDDTTAGRADGIAVKKAAEVDDVQYVVKILSIGLNPHIQTLGLVNIRSRRRVELKGWKSAPTVEVDAIHDLLSIDLNYTGDALGKSFAVRALEIERETRVVLNAGSA